MARPRKTRKTADIDITPLIDVLFMLIIFFVLTASFVQGKLDVELPSGEGVSSGSDGAITVTVEKNGAILWAGNRIDKTDISILARKSKNREILLAGDRATSYGVIAEILSILRKEGITSVGLMMQGGSGL